MVPLALLTACTGADSAAPLDSAADTAETGDTETEPVWSEHRIESNSSLKGIYASGAGVYAAGTDGFVFEGGNDDNWDYMDVRVDNGADFTGLWGQGAKEDLFLAASAAGGQIARFSAGSWTVDSVGSEDLLGISGTAPDSLVALARGHLYTFDGTTWTNNEVASELSRLVAVYAAGKQAVAVGEAGLAVRYANGSFEKMDTGVETNLQAVSGTGPDDVWAVGYEGTALHWDGSKWTSSDTGTTQTLWGVWAASSGVVFAVGGDGTAIRYDGEEWEDLPTGVDNHLYTVHGANDDNVWTGGNTGMAMQYKD